MQIRHYRKFPSKILITTVSRAYRDNGEVWINRVHVRLSIGCSTIFRQVRCRVVTPRWINFGIVYEGLKLVFFI